MRRTNSGLSKRCGCPSRVWAKCAHPWHFAFCHGKDERGRKIQYRFALNKAIGKPADYPMSKTEAEGFRDRLRDDIRAGRLNPDGSPRRARSGCSRPDADARRRVRPLSRSVRAGPPTGTARDRSVRDPYAHALLCDRAGLLARGQPPRWQAVHIDHTRRSRWRLRWTRGGDRGIAGGCGAPEKARGGEHKSSEGRAGRDPAGPATRSISRRQEQQGWPGRAEPLQGARAPLLQLGRRSRLS